MSNSEPQPWRISKTTDKSRSRIDYNFGFHDSDEDLLAIENALFEKFNAVEVSVIPGPYCTVTQLSVRGIPIVLMNDSNYEIYYYTDLTNEQVADQLATELECYLNGSGVRDQKSEV